MDGFRASSPGMREGEVGLSQMDALLIAKLVTLIAIANGAPVIAKRLFGSYLAFPADGGHVFTDGRPIFGSAKTWRGIVFSLLATVIGAFLLGLDWTVGFLISATAMAGDLFSSFIKRRLGYNSSSRAVGLDQVPEALFPLATCNILLPVTLAGMVIGTCVFVVGSLILSRILFRIHIRDRPY